MTESPEEDTSKIRTSEANDRLPSSVAVLFTVPLRLCSDNVFTVVPSLVTPAETRVPAVKVRLPSMVKVCVTPSVQATETLVWTEALPVELLDWL